MKIVDKFEIHVRSMLGDNTEVRKIKPEILKFTDGSIRVTIANINELNLDASYAIAIACHAESLDDVGVVAQIKDIFARKFGITQFSLYLSGTLYTRYDRVMLDDKSDAFGAAIFAMFVNSLNLSAVVLYDPHSEVISNWINNSVTIDQSKLLGRMHIDGEIDLKESAKVCPDAGAKKKLRLSAAVYCDKTRDVATGKITGMKVTSTKAVIPGKRLLVIDDICEGGGTFLGLADAIAAYENKDLTAYPLDLYVTHGIFSKNAIPKLLEKYSKIYVYFLKESVYNGLTESQRENVIVHNLIQGI